LSVTVTTPSPAPSQVEAAIVGLLSRRAASSSICPSDAARSLSEPRSAAWRAWMPLVRHVAQAMAERGVLQITRGDQAVRKTELHQGAIRLRRGAGFDAWRADQNESSL
jgi:hypothetical protein